MIVAGTTAGVHLLEPGRTIDLGEPVRAIAAGERWWAVVGSHEVLSSRDAVEWETFAAIPELAIRCLLPADEGVFAGTAEAHLYRLAAGGASRVEGFEEVKGRDEWFTPWGGPPDTRSASVDTAGTLYVNVHVGGIPRSRDGGESWEPTIDIHADVHEVLAHGAVVFAACARGLAVSDDGGTSWRIDADDLHGRYCRAVAVAGDTLLVIATTGPFANQAAVYRRPLDAVGPFERCGGGLPHWLGASLDTPCLAADGSAIALGTDAGEVWVSLDEGRTWELAAAGLAPIICLAAVGT